MLATDQAQNIVDAVIDGVELKASSEGGGYYSPRDGSAIRSHAIELPQDRGGRLVEEEHQRKVEAWKELHPDHVECEMMTLVDDECEIYCHFCDTDNGRFFPESIE